MKRFAMWLVIGGVTLGGAVRAQSPRRLPIIAGNGLVNVLVELDGTVKTWGNPHAMDPSPSLGDGVKPSSTAEVKEPRALAGVRDIADAAVAITHVLLLKRDGTVLAWGGNDGCELGTGDEKDRLAPVPLPGLRGVMQIAAADGVSGAVLSDGTVWMWGSGMSGQLGNGLSGRTTPCGKVPAEVEGLTGVKLLSLDGGSAVALKDDGTVWGWGANSAGELCDGTKERRTRPVQMKGIANAISVVVNGNSTVVLGDGTVRTCGSNVDGALGDPARGVKEHLTPFKVPGLTGARSARMNSAVIVHLADGTLVGWGTGYHGALGDGHGDQITVKPHPPTGLGPVLAHYVSGNTSYAIRADGTVMVWCIPATSGKTEFVLTPIPVFTVKLNGL